MGIVLPKKHGLGLKKPDCSMLTTATKTLVVHKKDASGEALGPPGGHAP